MEGTPEDKSGLSRASSSRLTQIGHLRDRTTLTSAVSKLMICLWLLHQTMSQSQIWPFELAGLYCLMLQATESQSIGLFVIQVHTRFLSLCFSVTANQHGELLSYLSSANCYSSFRFVQAQSLCSPQLCACVCTLTSFCEDQFVLSCLLRGDRLFFLMREMLGLACVYCCKSALSRTLHKHRAHRSWPM